MYPKKEGLIMSKMMQLFIKVESVTPVKKQDGSVEEGKFHIQTISDYEEELKNGSKFKSKYVTTYKTALSLKEGKSYICNVISGQYSDQRDFGNTKAWHRIESIVAEINLDKGSK
jgi:hypothetical protein